MIEGLEHNNSKLLFFRILVMLANNWYIIILWNNNNLRFKVALFFFSLGFASFARNDRFCCVCVLFKKIRRRGNKNKKKDDPSELRTIIFAWQTLWAKVLFKSSDCEATELHHHGSFILLKRLHLSDYFSSLFTEMSNKIHNLHLSFFLVSYREFCEPLACLFLLLKRHHRDSWNMWQQHLAMKCIHQSIHEV